MHPSTPKRRKPKKQQSKKHKKDLGNVDVGDFRRDIFKKQGMGYAAQQVAQENAILSGGVLLIGLQTAVANGTMTLPDGEDIVGALEKFKETGEELAGPVISFLKDNAQAIAAELNEENMKLLMEACRNLGELGVEAFQVLGWYLSEGTEWAQNVDWERLGSDVSAMAAAAGEAMKEAGRTAGKLMSDAWEQLSGDEKSEACGGDSEKASAISKSLEELSKTGSGLAADAVEVLGSICDKIKDEGVQLLQKAVGVLKRANVDQVFNDLWDKLGEVVASLQEAGRAVAPVVLESIGSAVDVVKDFTGDLMSGAAAEAAKENAKTAARILLGALEGVGDVAEDAVDALKKMRDEAAPLVGKALAQVKNCLDAAVAKLAEVDVEKLQKSVAYAAQAGVAGMHDLFNALKESVGAAIAAGRTLLNNFEMPNLEDYKEELKVGGAIVAFVALAPVVGVAGAAGGLAAAAAALAKEDAKKAGAMMLEAFEKLKEEGAEISEDALEALKKLKEEGLPLVEDAAQEVSWFCRDMLAKISDEDVEKLQRAVGAAAKAGLAGMEMIWDGLQDAMDAAIAAGREIAKVDWNDIAANVGDFMNQGAAIVSEGFGELGPIYKMARSEVSDAMLALTGAAAEGCAKCMDLLKLEIFRDVFQALGMFFAKLFSGLSEGMAFIGVAVWGTIGNIVAIDWGEVVKSPIFIAVAITLLVIVAVFVIFAFIYFMYLAIAKQSDALREGHETESWSAKKKEQARKTKFMGIVLMLSLSIYLPVARTAFSIMYCDVPYRFGTLDALSMKEGEVFDCEESLMRFVLLPLFLLFSIAFPALCFWLISTNKPKGSPENPNITHDDDGYEVEFTDKLYHERVMTDRDQIACPYRSLYLGFERRWAFYKIAMMLFKFFLVLPIIFAAKQWEDKSTDSGLVSVSVTAKEIYLAYNDCIEDPAAFQNSLMGSDPTRQRLWTVGAAGLGGATVDPLENAGDCEEFFEKAFDVKPTPIQPGVTLLIVLLFAFFSAYASPFVDPNADRMDISGRIAMSCTVLIATIYAAATIRQKSGGDMVLGIALNVVNAINFIFLAGCIVTGYPCIRLKWKNATGRIDFSDTAAKNVRFVSADEAIPTWDLAREIRHRIWHAFWDTVLLNACGEEVATRMLELKDKTRDYGMQKIKIHWAGFNDPRIAGLRMEARTAWEGVDLYWDDPTGPLDKHLDSASCFGKMYIRPYPFHMVIVYDDCDDVTFIWDDVERFLALQKRPDIAAKRENRLKFRALSQAQTAFRLPFSQMETETVPDGTETYRDSEGKTQTRTVYSTVTFECFYTNGTVSVAANTNKEMAPGFNCTMLYCDGYGDGIKPRTGQPFHFANRRTTKGREHVGIDDSFDMNERMGEVLAISESLWAPQMEPLLSGYTQYRTDLVAQFEAKKGILHNGFWYYVYNNDQLDRAALLSYIRDFETNPVLKNFPTEHQAGLNFLFMRMQFVAHPVNAFWFTLWDDIWEENKDMNAFKDLQDDIAPTSGNSIAYYPMEREKLVEWLSSKGLWGGGSCCFCGSPKLFSDEMLDVIYARFEKEKGEAMYKI